MLICLLYNVADQRFVIPFTIDDRIPPLFHTAILAALQASSGTGSSSTEALYITLSEIKLPTISLKKKLLSGPSTHF